MTEVSPSPVKNAWFSARHSLGNHRLSFPALALLPGKKVLVGRDSDACIGGFIRSGNTFAFEAFKRSNKGLKIAHHVHASEQVRRAVRLGVPCALLIREPLDAVTSLVVFEEGRLAPGVALRAYCGFHDRVADVRDSVAICSFEEVLSNPAVIARRLNERYGTDFAAAAMDPRMATAVLSDIERYHFNRRRRPATFSVPTPVKEGMKPAARSQVGAHPLLPQAERIYAQLTSKQVEGEPTADRLELR